MSELTVRPLNLEDREQWGLLYQGYADFYEVRQTPEMRDTVWSWLHDETKEPQGLVAAKPSGQLVGLAHYRSFARPLSATTGCFLDDLFVGPDERGSGAADALINAIKEIAAVKGWSVIRWITADNNYRARAVYDRLATKTQWVTYDIKL